MGDQIMKRPLAGGWSPSKLDDPMITEAAQFCLKTLREDESLQDRYSFSVSEADVPTVVEASQQVVAGMNFRLTILIRQENDCVGAFRATVYNHFGNLSVTEWKDELSCKEGEAILQEVQQDSKEEGDAF
eukprot:CAMPEP_0176009822 /NCGR_PEP_ID=MMETSP0120_2-20121206/4448_1 /TAXON_ID=160619 /ORGANISM="Kryptoperidinium foliaceum, Strain CCMP 1326" /LENGTH=129 /DNA_ID=CAMNT_0017342629 /DNA_START=211 /DNA_END=600 /DNA_ORIENTATION=+